MSFQKFLPVQSSKIVKLTILALVFEEFCNLGPTIRLNAGYDFTSVNLSDKTASGSLANPRLLVILVPFGTQGSEEEELFSLEQ